MSQDTVAAGEISGSDAEEGRHIPSEDHDALLGKSSLLIIMGVLALAMYWSWIFSIFHSDVLNPLGSDAIESYLLLCVSFAGFSAISMGASAVFGAFLNRMMDRIWFSVIVAIASAFIGFSALLVDVGVHMPFPGAVAVWAVGGFVSSFVFLKTGPFFVWLRRTKLMRCIAWAFLLAACFFLLTNFLYRSVADMAVLLFPVLSTACSQVVNRNMGYLREGRAGESHRHHLNQVLAKLREVAPGIPRTFLYTLIFGASSYTVLMLAASSGLVPVIGISICLSAILFFVFAFLRVTASDVDQYRLFLIPLIAVAVLPFPYLSMLYSVFFLSLVIFGFTCFDAITWGDLADEIRDRGLEVYVSFEIPTFVNFAGIFVGWGMAALMRSLLGAGLYEAGFSIFSILVVIALVILLVADIIKLEKENAAEPNLDAFQEAWRAKCGEIATRQGLTAQERNIFLMMARGRNQNYIAEKLVISPHTVKTHAYHIYKKLDVHSQQELIDMVEKS